MMMPSAVVNGKTLFTSVPILVYTKCAEQSILPLVISKKSSFLNVLFYPRDENNQYVPSIVRNINYMKRKVRTPYFEIGIKNYLYGDRVLELALRAEEAAKKYDIDVMMIVPYTEIRRVAEHTERLIILAPYMDTLRPGRGIAEVLPEALKDAGADGVVINHCERAMSLPAIRETIARADELDMLSFACADTIAEAQAIAHLHPDIINPEPTELIGGGQVSDMGFVLESIRAIKQIDPSILVEQAASISTGQQVYDFIYAGAEAVGACSAICTAPVPGDKAEEMIAAVRRAADDLKAKNSD